MIEGKTKIVTTYPYNNNLVIIETKDSLTCGDGVRNETIPDIGKHKTKQTSNIFSLLELNNIKTSFIFEMSPNEMLCENCDMLPIEWVMRRYAWGSFLTIHPELKSKPQPVKITSDDSPPYIQLFHKHTIIMPPLVDTPVMMSENNARELYLKDGKWADNVYTDPFISVEKDTWKLYSRLATITPDTQPLMVIDPLMSLEEYEHIVNTLCIPTFLTLENSLSKIDTEHGPIVLADIKIEIGKRKVDNQYVVADVIDNDSWRIWPGGDPSKQLDKQAFRENDSLSKVFNNYELVTEITNRF